jgi:ABC-type bacteriocin/lantibiotic exporter with double-glycine peptidase domain
MNLLKEIIGLNRFYFYKIIIFFSIILSLLEIMGISILPLFFSFLLNEEKTKIFLEKFYFYNAFDLSTYNIFYLLFFFILIIFLTKNILAIFFKLFEEKLYKNVNIELSGFFFYKYLRAPYEYHINNNPSESIRTIYLVDSVIQYMRSLNYIVIDLILVTLIILTLAFVNFFVTITAVIITIFLILYYFFFLKIKIKNVNSVVVNNEGLKLKSLNQGLLGIKFSKILKIEKFLLEKLNFYNSVLQNVSFFNKKLNIFPRYLGELIFIFLIFVGVFFFYKNYSYESLASLSLFAIATARIFPALISLYRNLISFNNSKLGLKFIHSELIKLNDAIDIGKDNFKVDAFNKNIIFDKITYSYNNSNLSSIDNISFEIKKGEFVGILGPSGSGKSTLINLFMGLISSQQGKIVIDDRIVPKNSLCFWSDILGYVPQEIYLIDDTIKRNIALGIDDEKIDINKINSAISLSLCEEFILNFKDGLNQVVGQNGIKLSGGQKQRIGLARALYNNPKILVLDEITSSLDKKLEGDVIKIINSLKRRFTIVMISHEISAFAHADKIINLESGKILSIVLK